jgi:ribonucleoside-diphosphate reductase alpha chain
MVKELISQEISIEIWKDKYRNEEEPTIADSQIRVIKGVYEKDLNSRARLDAMEALENMEWLPGGRINAGAGTNKRVTLINCFVSDTIHDSMEGIMQALTIAALTQQQGGGIGMDFSTLRPCGAIVRRTGSVSTGPLPFMDMWNSMCGTIKSSGARRGAMMGVMSDWHPDIMKFIVAKREEKRLTNFNVSVLVSDALMDAVKRGLDWELGFSQPLADPSKTVEVKERDGRPWYVYERFPAKKLWDSIISNTYDWAEPGVIFIDRINQLNNLNYCEVIRATNPCGEQPLPPNGDCNLGHVNLAGMVMKPFTNDAEWNRKRVEEVTRIGVRFLDNVLDVSNFPTEEQRQEALNKRRTGLGYTAIANLMQQMKIKYGSRKSTDLTSEITQAIALAAYSTSCDLAKERGPFPFYNKDKFLSAPFIKKLPSWLKDKIAQYGVRNGVLLTIAPVGTGSVLYGNLSSGIEPTIFHVSDRKVLNPDGSFRKFERIEEYGYKLFKHYHPGVEEVEGQPVNLPSYMVTANDLSVEEHLKVQAAAQKWIDSSISKTINCPKDITYQDFEKVYLQAWDMGLKGCTTYRPSDVRGAVITASGTEKTNGSNGHGEILIPPRPESLESKTYKVKWPQAPDAFYITISDIVEEGKKRPFEIFINSKSVKHQEWITALTRCISAIFRRGGDVTFIVEELMQVYSINEGCWVDQEYTPSLVARIGKVIKQHMADSGEGFISIPISAIAEATAVTQVLDGLGEFCNQCGNPTVYKQEGCRVCRNCGFSTCD